MGLVGSIHKIRVKWLFPAQITADNFDNLKYHAPEFAAQCRVAGQTPFPIYQPTPQPATFTKTQGYCYFLRNLISKSYCSRL